MASKFLSAAMAFSYMDEFLTDTTWSDLDYVWRSLPVDYKRQVTKDELAACLSALSIPIRFERNGTTYVRKASKTEAKDWMDTLRGDFHELLDTHCPAPWDTCYLFRLGDKLRARYGRERVSNVGLGKMLDRSRFRTYQKSYRGYPATVIERLPAG